MTNAINSTDIPAIENSLSRPDRMAHCPACNAVEQQKYLYPVNNCAVTRCAGCGVGRALPDAFDPAAYYTGDYFNGGREDGYFDYEHSADVLRREFRAIVEDLQTQFGPGARLLEVGCAYGYFLQEARHHFDVEGIEISRDAVHACHRAGLTQVRCGTIASVQLDELGGFDVIVMLDVIEHLEHPSEDIERLASLLRPGGMIVISTGDFSSFFARRMGRRWRLLTPPQHLWFFTPKAIDHMARRSGLRTLRVKYPWKLIPVSLIAHQAKRMLGWNWLPIPKLLSAVGVPVNLFDAMRISLRKELECAASATPARSS